MTRIDSQTAKLVPEWWSLQQVAEALDIDEKSVRRLLQDRKLVGFDLGEGQVSIPATFVRDGQVVKGLSGTFTLLDDAGYDDEEALRWLFTPQESLPGAPVEALAEDRGKEVKRRAQALGF